ncbi:MAG: hypothetical protein PVF33_02220 [Candidatus Latescibacterota bacterium]|jgi:hypothetical protein
MARVLKVFTVFAALVVVAIPAAAQLTTHHLTSDAEMLSALSDTLFVGEGRIGDGWSAATFEIDLGGDTGNPATTAQYGWPNGTAVTWTLTYDSSTDLVTFTVDGIPLSYVTPLDGFTDIFVRARAVNAGSDIVVDDLVLDGAVVGDQSHAAGDGLDILWISGGTLFDGFTMTGRATMSWTGTMPSQSRLAFQLKVGRLKPVKVYNKVSWGKLKAYYNN